jgi:predicted dehydrogenase
MGKELKAGIVGAGYFSRDHAKAFQSLGMHIIAVADINPQASERLASEFNIPQTFADYRELVALDELDIVSVTLPVFLHAPVTIAALNHGKHVLCEKPMAMNAREALQIAEASRKARRFVAYGSGRSRYGAAPEAAKALIAEGKLGQIYRADGRHIRRRNRPGIEYQPDTTWWLDSKKAGGGIAIDVAVYNLDLMMDLLGWPKVTTVSATTFQGIPHNLPKGTRYDVEEDANIFIRCGKDMSVTLQVAGASNIGYGSDKRVFDEVVVLGSHGGLRINPFSFYAEEMGIPVEITPAWLKGEGGTARIVKEMVRAIEEGGAPPATTADEGVRLMEILDAIYKSARLGHEVRLT